MPLLSRVGYRATPMALCRRTTGTTLRNGLYRRTALIKQPWRSFMDVHQRPSHSRMFLKEGNRRTNEDARKDFRKNHHDEEYDSEWEFFRLLLQRAALAAGLVYGITEYVGDITLCEGPSMLPTIYSSADMIYMDKLSLRMWGVQDGCVGKQRADAGQARQAAFEEGAAVITATTMSYWHEPRIPVDDVDFVQSRQTLPTLWQQISTPLSVGDVIVVTHPQRRGTVCKRVLGLPGDVVLNGSHRGSLLVVPDGHVWLEGDNPSNSCDSREYGPVPMALIVGRVLLRMWPLKRDQPALMLRGQPPRVSDDNDKRPRTGKNRFGWWRHRVVLDRSGGSIVLPAGYNGQEVVKSYNEWQERRQHRE